MNVKVTNCRYSITSTTSYKSKQCKRAPVHQHKQSSNKHRYINAKADNNEYQDYKIQQQWTMNTTIIYRYNYLSTNYNHFRTICPDLQFANLVEPEVFRSFLPSKFEDFLSFVHNPNSNSSHSQRDNTLLVTFLNQSITIDSTVDLSILLHLRVRVTALGCVLARNET